MCTCVYLIVFYYDWYLRSHRLTLNRTRRTEHTEHIEHIEHTDIQPYLSFRRSQWLNAETQYAVRTVRQMIVYVLYPHSKLVDGPKQQASSMKYIAHMQNKLFSVRIIFCLLLVWTIGSLSEHRSWEQNAHNIFLIVLWYFCLANLFIRTKLNWKFHLYDLVLVIVIE